MNRRKKRIKEIAEATGYMPGSIEEFKTLEAWDDSDIPNCVRGTHSLYCKSVDCDLHCAVMEDLMIVWQQATSVERRRCVEIARQHRPHTVSEKLDVGAGHCIADQIMSVEDPDPIL